MATSTRAVARRLSPADLSPLPVVPTAIDDDPLGFPGYPEALARARDGDEDAESVSVGVVHLDGLPVVVALGRFGFLGGSMGRVHGERVTHAMAVARERRWPLLAVISSGGARMQEGMLSLVQLARTAEGVRSLRAAGVPVLTHLTHPSTGGVYASYGALGDVVIADAGATIGFAGPRVVEATTGEQVGDQDHTAEVALAGGLVDEVVDPEAALAAQTAWVGLLHPARRGDAWPHTDHVDEPVVEHEAWDAVQRARHPERAGARDLLVDVFDGHRELHGDRAGADDPAVVTALARLGERPVVVLGTDRRGRAEGPGRLPGRPTAAGYRKLRRATELAGRLEMPVVSLIDTPGADPSPASDHDGLAVAIAETFVALLGCEVPTVGVVTGEGGSGGALALGATDRLLLQDDAVFEVIAPEGAAAILHRDPIRAEQVAPQLRPTASELRRLGIADRVLPGPTTHDPHTAATALRVELSVTLHELEDAGPMTRLARRRTRYGPTPATGGDRAG